jgi:hypothetical protein
MRPTNLKLQEPAAIIELSNFAGSIQRRILDAFPKLVLSVLVEKPGPTWRTQQQLVHKDEHGRVDGIFRLQRSSSDEDHGPQITVQLRWWTKLTFGLVRAYLLPRILKLANKGNVQYDIILK